MAQSAETGLRHAAEARRILALAGIADAALERALVAVPRAPFGIEVAEPGAADGDAAAAAQASPARCMRWVHALGAQPGEHIVHVGAGSGFVTAILAELVGVTGRVTAIEIDPDRADLARSRLVPWANVTVLCADGADWPQEPVERVFVSVAVTHPATPWLSLLGLGGRLVFPFGPPPEDAAAPAANARAVAVLAVERRQRGYAAHCLETTLSTRAAGRLAATGGAANPLRRAFGRGGLAHIRSLRLDATPETPRLWLFSPEWSLSYDPPPGG